MAMLQHTTFDKYIDNPSNEQRNTATRPQNTRNTTHTHTHTHATHTHARAHTHTHAERLPQTRSTEVDYSLLITATMERPKVQSGMDAPAFPPPIFDGGGVFSLF
jgi:hypothetical protein